MTLLPRLLPTCEDFGMPDPVDTVAFRHAMSRFVTGVTVVTSGVGDLVHGMTCNAFCSITLTPPTVLVSLVKTTRTARLIDETGVFAVNILSEDQVPLSDRFAGRHKDKDENRFEGFPWTTAVTGSPIFPGCQAHLDCTLVAAYDGGDHTLYLGEVLSAHIDATRKPLIYGYSRYLVLDHLKPLA
jgi:flavin reductase (DIM6/NTAB) family NADH-FMN oxidoreductase RutF